MSKADTVAYSSVFTLCKTETITKCLVQYKTIKILLTYTGIKKSEFRKNFNIQCPTELFTMLSDLVARSTAPHTIFEWTVFEWTVVC